jgi:hypothetical protein
MLPQYTEPQQGDQGYMNEGGTVDLEPMRREFVAEIRALRAELGSDLRSINEGLKVLNSRTAKNELGIDKLSDHQAVHASHERDHAIQEARLLERSNALITRSGTIRLYGAMAIIGGAAAAISRAVLWFMEH